MQIIGKDEPPRAELFFEDLVLDVEELDAILLPAVAPAGPDGQQELLRLEDEVHT